jgi:hypothetical protein
MLYLLHTDTFICKLHLKKTEIKKKPGLGASDKVKLSLSLSNSLSFVYVLNIYNLSSSDISLIFIKYNMAVIIIEEYQLFEV